MRICHLPVTGQGRRVADRLGGQDRPGVVPTIVALSQSNDIPTRGNFNTSLTLLTFSPSAGGEERRKACRRRPRWNSGPDGRRQADRHVL
jgi:hypothetical protein